MKVVKIQCSFNQTVQIHQYEPVNFFASAEAEINEAEQEDTKLQECIKKLLGTVKVQVEEEIKLVQAGKIPPQKLF